MRAHAWKPAPKSSPDNVILGRCCTCQSRAGFIVHRSGNDLVCRDCGAVQVFRPKRIGGSR